MQLLHNKSLCEVFRVHQSLSFKTIFVKGEREMIVTLEVVMVVVVMEMGWGCHGLQTLITLTVPDTHKFGPSKAAGKTILQNFNFFFLLFCCQRLIREGDGRAPACNASSDMDLQAAFLNGLQFEMRWPRTK